jgi:anaerobic ribonucleoside-triphosphate reductase activating protein
MDIQIGHILQSSEIYGPGIRSVLWVQGCTLACEGCWNTQYWAANEGLTTTTKEILKQWKATQGLEGITLLGGEPLQQPEAVFHLIQGAKDLGLSVFLYTGYEPEEFTSIMQSCFNMSDIVVTGRYVHSLRNTALRWRGSTNQVVHFPTPMYQSLKILEQHEVEVHLSSTGELSVYGYANDEFLTSIEVKS